MGNVLEFTLGLETHEFLHRIGLSSSAIIGLSKAWEGLNFVGEKLTQKFEQGIGLQHLSKRVGESVGNLYQLQKGFEFAGISGDNVGSALFFLQKSLGGVNEMGEKTEDIFKRLGLNLAELKQGAPTEALKKILESLKGLNQDSAASAASSIFGRMNAANMVQLAHSTKEFAEGMEAAAKGAKAFQANAANLEQLHLGMLKFKQQMDDAWISVAANLGTAIQASLEAIKVDRLEELVSLALKAAVQDAADFMTTKLSEAAQKIANPQHGESKSFWGRVGYGAAGVGTGLLALGDEIGSMLHVPGADKLADKRVDQANRFFGKAGMGGGALDTMADAFVGGVKGEKNEYREKLQALVKALHGNPFVEAAGGKDLKFGSKEKAEGDTDEKKIRLPEAANAWGKMGFIMNGNTGNIDYSAKTAMSTARLVVMTEKMAANLEAMASGFGGMLFNQP